MQTTNVQINGTNTTPGNLSFTTSLNTPVIPNDYYMSIDKFQVDTSELPVLVVEPDLTTNPFVPNKTIHKVGIMTSDASFKKIPGTDIFSIPAGGVLARSISASLDGSVIAVGYPTITSNGVTNRGKVYFCNSNRVIQEIVLNSSQINLGFGISVSVSKNGQVIAIGTDTIGTVTYIYNISTNSLTTITKSLLNSRTEVDLDNLGTSIVIGYPHPSQDGEAAILKLENGTWTTKYKIDSNDFQYNGVPLYGSWGLVGLGNKVSMNFSGTNAMVGTIGSRVAYMIFANSDFNGKLLIWGNHSSFGETVAIGPGEFPSTNYYIGEPGNGRGKIYQFRFNPDNEDFAQTHLYDPVGSHTRFGQQISLTNDGSTLYTLQLLSGNSQILKINNGTRQIQNFNNSFTNVVFTNYGTSSNNGIITTYTNNGINTLFQANTNDDVNLLVPVSVGNYITFPPNLKNVSSVTNVMWESEKTAPVKDVLTGTNTIEFPYYHCNSYSKFIKVVNNAIASAYVENYKYLYTNWYPSLQTGYQQQFIDIVARSFAIPPFLEFTNSIAKLYTNQLFNGSNYLLPPLNWEISNGSSIATTTKFPLDLKIVFNASLYSLFNTFPATPTIINGEQFYILELNNITNNVELSLSSSFPTIERYSFLQTYVTNEVITIPYSASFEYPNSSYYLITEQEAPTLDIWNPIYSFALVIPQDISIKDQLKTLSLYGSSSTSKNEKADFIIKIDGKYRPTFIYSENSNVNLIGTTPITTLEMNVYYISKTGILVPFKLSRSGSASLRILFEKKRKTRISII
jgi:hypothetical protein